MEDKMTTKSAKNEEVAKVPEPMAFGDVETPRRYNPVTDSWDTLLQEADEVLGHDLAKDEILDALENVPFLITRVTFRPSDMGIRKNYVTCECVVASRDLLERRRVNLATLPFDPGDHIVFNDGSTGIYRQIVAYLYGKGFIALPDPVVANGKAGESSFDLPPDKWADMHAGELRYTPTGDAIYIADVRILAKRGIRISDGYENEWTKDGKTRYLA
jgi:hypothetical protein